MTRDMWEFLIIWFGLCLLLLRILSGILNNKVLALKQISQEMFKSKNMPKWQDALGVVAMKAAPAAGDGIANWIRGVLGGMGNAPAKKK